MNPSHIIEVFRSVANRSITRQGTAGKTFTAIGSWGMCALLFLLATATPASAQTTVRLETRPPRIFTGANYSNVYSNNIVIVDLTTALGTQLINLWVDAPPGITPTLSTNSCTNDVNVTLFLAVTNLSAGTYTLTFNASNTVSLATFTSNINVYAGTVWINTNAASSTNWSVSANWSGGAAPSTGDNVKFEDAPPLGGTNAVTITATNAVNSSTTIGSLFYIRSLNNQSHSTAIATNVTLSITGTNGFGVNVDSVNGNNKSTTVNISGQGGRIVVNNTNANFTVNAVNSGNNATTLQMSGLDLLTADVSRFGIFDVNLAKQGGIGTQSGNAFLARTNIIRAYAAEDYSGVEFNTSIQMVDNGEVFNNGGAYTVNMGISNAFFADSLGIGMGRCASQATFFRFNPNLARDTNIIVGVSTNFVTNSMFASFRNHGGGRMTLVAAGVDNGTNDVTSGTGGRLDFTAGTVDMLVDKIWLGRDRFLMSTNANSRHEGRLEMGRGIIDANVVIAGYQQYTNDGRGQAIITVGTNGLLRINDYLELGHTTGDRSNNVDNPYSGAGFGQVTVRDAGTLMANKILVGGPKKLSGNNTITLAVRGNLIVSNTIAASDKMLTTLDVSGSSTLTLHLNGTNTGHYVYATNMTIAANQVLTIASTTNLTIPPTGTNVPLFFFENGSGLNFSTVNMPLPMRGTAVPGATANETDLLILTNAPKNLIWRGTVNNNWNLTNKNWLDTSTGLLTNYFTGDAVTFDDLGGVPTTVNVQVSLVPDSIVVSNSGNSFVFSSGGGSILGGSLVKNGSGSLAIDVSTSIPVQINQGTLTGLGSIASVVVASGATMDFSGTIGPSGVSCAGMATLRGTTTGGLTVQSGGILTNAASGTTSDSLEAQDGSLLYNAGTMGELGSSTVRSNAVFINAGNLGTAGINSTLTVSGVFKDTGAGGLIYLTTLDISGGTGTNNNNAGTFIPGGDGIGVTIIRSPGVAGTTFSGRVRFGTGSTNLFKVDLGASPSNTVLRAPWIDYGPSVGAPSFNGGFVWVTNVGGSPLAAGHSFGIFTYVDGTIPIQFASSNSYPNMLPTVPGPGLAWNLNNVKFAGIVAVKSVPTTGTNITFSAAPIGGHITSNVNNVATNFFTNNVIYSQLSWPSNYIGWHLEEKLANRTNGLNSTNSDWTPIFESYFTNVIYTTNIVSSNSVGFYRMAYP